MGKIFGFFSGLFVFIAWLLIVAFAVSAVWAFLIKAYFFMFISILFVVILYLPVAIKHQAIRLVTFIVSLVIVLSISSFSVNPVVKDVNSGIHALCLKLWTKNPLPLFTVRDKAAIYGLNIMMGITGLALYPEAGVETLLMVIPPPKNGVRVFKSNFPLKSGVLRRYLDPYIKDIDKPGFVEKVRFKPVRVVWHLSDYPIGMPEARYALALNPCFLTWRTDKIKGKWQIYGTAEVGINYPKEVRVTLIKKPELKLDEGLFWVIQQCGWIYPYRARWEFNFTVNP